MISLSAAFSLAASLSIAGASGAPKPASAPDPRCAIVLEGFFNNEDRETFVSMGFTSDDRIVDILGLETVLQDPERKGLSSFLGCFRYSGDGTYLGGIVMAYDFSRFKTKDMVDLIADHCFPKGAK